MRTPAFKWDDLQIVLAVARHGSATQASKALNMTQATISRRLQALEEALGHALFIRTPEGMLPTELAQMLLPQAEQMEQSAFDVASTAREFDGEPRGTVRMALPEDMTAVQVVPRLPELFARYPRLKLDLYTGSMVADLTRMEADLAIRLVRPTQGNLRMQTFNTTGFSIYGTPSYLEGRTHAPLDTLDWIDWSEELSHIPEARWRRTHLPNVSPRIQSNSMRVRRNAVLAGLGVAILPDAMAHTWTDLVAVPHPFTPLPPLTLWLVSHARTRYTPRVSAVWDFILEQRDDLYTIKDKTSSLLA